MRDAFIEELTLQAKLNPGIILVVGDLGFGVVDEFARELPQQFVNAGVSEQMMIGLAAGLATAGHQVFVYSIANFPTMRCLEQIRNDVAYNALDVTIVSVGAGLAYGVLGYTHHAVEDIAVMRALPRIRVLSPADPVEARQCVSDCLRFSGPKYVRLGKSGECVLHEPAAVLGDLTEPLLLRPGSEIVIAATGSVARQCLLAAELLSSYGLEAQVWSVPTIRPFPINWLRNIVSTRLLITVEEHVREGGFGSALLEAANDLSLSLNVRRLGLSGIPPRVVGTADYLREAAQLTVDAIVLAALNGGNESDPSGD